MHNLNAKFVYFELVIRYEAIQKEKKHDFIWTEFLYLNEFHLTLLNELK